MTPASPTDAAVESMVVRPRGGIRLGYAWIELDPSEDVGVVDLAGAITVQFGQAHVHVTPAQLKELFDRAGVVLMDRERQAEVSAA